MNGTSHVSSTALAEGWKFPFFCSIRSLLAGVNRRSFQNVQTNYYVQTIPYDAKNLDACPIRAVEQWIATVVRLPQSVKHVEAKNGRAVWSLIFGAVFRLSSALDIRARHAHLQTSLALLISRPSDSM